MKNLTRLLAIIASCIAVFTSNAFAVYDPTAGRFLAPDPMGHASDMSLYGFCNGDPINKVDPDGRLAKGFTKGAVQGDFATYDNNLQRWSGFAGQIGVGLSPFGVLGDVRDIASAGMDIWNGTGTWTGLGIASIGIIPGFSEAKKAWSAGSEVAHVAKPLNYISSVPMSGAQAEGVAKTYIIGGQNVTHSLGLGAPLGASQLNQESSKIFYHYTTSSESSFSKGLWSDSSVTDKLYNNPFQASQELGIPIPNKIIPIIDGGQFIPNTPSIVQPSFRFQGGGSDFINTELVPPSQFLPVIEFKKN